MKKVICKVEYDTEKSELVAKFTSGNFGEADGFEESLYVKADGKYFLYTNGGEDSIYKTENGKFFLYVNGGEESPYKKEDIKRLAPAKADEWLNAHV